MSNFSALTPGLIALGADSRVLSGFQSIDDSPRLGRVISASREIYLVDTGGEEITARPAGRLRSHGELPAVGDWVALAASSPQILELLPRRSRLSRQAAGKTQREQVVAANLDVVLLVMGLDRDYNLNRLERFSVMAWESGAEPVAVLTKKDLCPDSAAAVAEVEARLPGMAALALSAPRGDGLDALSPWLRPGRTLAMLGSSGAGKSTLANALLGEARLDTGAVREGDGRGRHTTTRRELLRLPGGALLLDNPGVREIQLWSSGEDGLGQAFDDVAALAEGCRFADCRHQDEPGCAVQAALRRGELAAERLASFFKLERELRSFELRQDVAARRKLERGFGVMSRRAQEAKQDLVGKRKPR
jgi:ribosome biogenesis GTPase